MIKILLAGKLLLPDHEISDSYLVLDDEKLIQFGAREEFNPPESGEIVDYSGYAIIAQQTIFPGSRVAISADPHDQRIRVLEILQTER